MAAGRECIVTVDEFGSWLEEHEALLWEIAKQPESPNVDRQVWAAVNDVMMKWEKVKRGG